MLQIFQSVGCDLVIGSGATLDECGECVLTLNVMVCICVRKNKQGFKEKQSAKPFCLYRAVRVYNALFLVMFFWRNLR